MSKTNTAASQPVAQGTERTHDLPWSDKKVAIFKALRKLGEATAAELAAEAKVSPRDVRHYSYHARAAGLVDVNSYEGAENKYYFALTTAGKKLDPDKELAKQQAAKAKAPASKPANGDKAGKSNAPKKAAAKAVKAATNPAPAKATAQPATAPAAGKRTAKAAASSK